MLQTLWCESSAVPPLMLQLGVLRCTMMQHTPRGSVSHGGAACRVALVQLGPRVAVSPPREPRAAPLPPRARRCADGHHQRKHHDCRDGMGDQSDDCDGNVRSDRRLGHRSGDDHGELVLPVE